MSVKFDDIRLSIQMGDAWVDVSEKVIGSVNVSVGIQGNGPLDRIASTGTMRFVLENIDNEFTPTHIACNSGFKNGAVCKLVVSYNSLTYTKFFGYIEAVSVKRGRGLAYYTEVTAVDFMNAFAVHELRLPDFAQNKKMGEVIALIVANMNKAPEATSYGTGQDTFLTAFDTVSGSQRALEELAKVTNSEFGSVYVTPGGVWGSLLTEDGDHLLLESGGRLAIDAPDEVLKTRGRYGHITVSSSATFTDEVLSNIDVSYGDNYHNDVKTIVYPRKVDSAATSVLFTLDSYIAIPAGETVTITGRYTDPDQKAQTITGIDMVTPAATTDYLFNTASDGSGTNITASLGVVAVYGTNGVEYTLTNNNASTGYVTFLQARGKGVYIFQPVEYNQTYATGISEDGRRTLNMDMPYHNNALVAADFASMLLDIYKTKTTRVDSITYDANLSASLMGYFCALNVGDRITLDIADLDLNSDYFIQQIELSIDQFGAARVRYLTLDEALLPASDYWKLDDVSYSQLGQTTKLGF